MLSTRLLSAIKPQPFTANNWSLRHETVSRSFSTLHNLMEYRKKPTSTSIYGLNYDMLLLNNVSMKRLDRYFHKSKDAHGQFLPKWLSQRFQAAADRVNPIVSSKMDDAKSKYPRLKIGLATDLLQIRKSPKPALYLGLAGLIPFMMFPSCMILSGTYLPKLAYAHMAYGASILSFVGGVRWGYTLLSMNSHEDEGTLSQSKLNEAWNNLGYSVAPSLIAWVALLLPWNGLAMVSVMGGLGAAAYFDLAMVQYPSWFRGMRIFLTSIAIFSLWLTLVCYIILSEAPANEKENKKKDKGEMNVNSNILKEKKNESR